MKPRHVPATLTEASPNPIDALGDLLAAAIGPRDGAEGRRLCNNGGEEREAGAHQHPALGLKSGERSVGQEEPDHEARQNTRSKERRARCSESSNNVRPFARFVPAG